MKKQNDGWVVVNPDKKIGILWFTTRQQKGCAINKFIQNSVVYGSWKAAYYAGYRLRRCRVVVE